AAGATPPFTGELGPLLQLPPNRIAALLDLARRRGELVRVADDLHYDPEVLRGIAERVREALAGGRGLTASELKPALGQPSRRGPLPCAASLAPPPAPGRRGELRVLPPGAAKAPAS